MEQKPVEESNSVKKMRKVDEVHSKSEESEMEMNEDSDSSTTRKKVTTHLIEESAQKYEDGEKKKRNCFC